MTETIDIHCTNKGASPLQHYPVQVGYLLAELS